ncbi:hypothetical protein SLA2020_039020 [Shorea laevis]
MDMSQVEGGSFVPFLAAAAAAAAAPLSITVVGFIFLRYRKQQKQQLDLSNNEESIEDGSHKEETKDE